MESTVQQLQSTNSNDNVSNSGVETECVDNLSTSISSTSIKESKTNLIVNYLPQNLTNDEFKAIFNSIGKIESCKLIRDKTNGQSLCYGFINYFNVCDAEKAVKTLNGQKVQNKTIKVSFARPSCESIKGANLYACGIPKNWSVADLNNYFNKCGNIITSRILYNENGQSKCVGFIRYDQREDAELAIKTLNGTVPFENAEEPITVKFANYPAALTNKIMASLPLTANATGFYPQSKSPIINPSMFSVLRQNPTTTLVAQTPSTTAYTPLTNSYNSFAAAVAAIPTTTTEYLTNTQQQFAPVTPLTPAVTLDTSTTNITTNSLSTLPSSTGWCIFVYSLSPDTEENVLWQLFGPFGAVQNVKIVRDYQTQKCKGFGFVTMTNYEEAIMAINSLNGFQLGNRILQVSFKANRHII